MEDLTVREYLTQKMKQDKDARFIGNPNDGCNCDLDDLMPGDDCPFDECRIYREKGKVQEKSCVMCKHLVFDSDIPNVCPECKNHSKFEEKLI